MKEATGELNMTVITVVAIVAVGALFTWFVWPTVKANLAINTACSTIDSKGNTQISQKDAQSAAQAQENGSTEGSVSCSSFTCTAYLSADKSVVGNCRKEA